MNDVLPETILKGLEDARAAVLRRSSRLCIHDGDRVHRILRLWDGGFAVGADGSAYLRGHVGLYDGMRHVADCLVVGCLEEDGERVYEYKRHTVVMDRAPVDFAREAEPPAGLISRLL